MHNSVILGKNPSFIQFLTRRSPMSKIILFYKYIDISNPQAILKWQQELCHSLGLKGRIIIATEGINGTLGGHQEKIQQYKTAMQAHPLFGGIDYKESEGSTEAFPRMRIVIKKEIVHLGLDTKEYTPAKGGTHLSPTQAHELVNQHPDNLLILDCRNSFESRVGTFEGSVKPEVNYFREFPAYVDNNLDLFKDKQVLMYCTGGVRCERASAYLKEKGVTQEVYQITGGVHKYVEQFPNGHFKGKNYVFDGRVSVKVTDDILTTCDICQKPYDDYTNCKNAICNKHFIACPACIDTLNNTCSENCKNLLAEGKVHSRPMRKKNYQEDALQESR